MGLCYQVQAPEQLTVDEQAIALMAQAHEENERAIRQCLSNEGQFKLYLLTTADMTFSRETNRCLWEGKQHLYEGRQPNNPVSGTTGDVKMLTNWIIEVYCKRSDPAWKGVQIDGVPLQFVPQTDSIRCVVDTKGGTRWFAEWMLEEDQAVQSVGNDVGDQRRLSTLKLGRDAERYQNGNLYEGDAQRHERHAEAGRNRIRLSDPGREGERQRRRQQRRNGDNRVTEEPAKPRG